MRKTKGGRRDETTKIKRGKKREEMRDKRREKKKRNEKVKTET